MPATVPRISGTGNIKVIHEKGYGNIAIMKRNFRNDHPEVTAFFAHVSNIEIKLTLLMFHDTSPLGPNVHCTIQLTVTINILIISRV